MTSSPVQDLDVPAEATPEVFDVRIGPLAEDTVENGIVAVVARADDDAGRTGPARGPVHDLHLPGGQIGDVSAHVVEENREVLDPGLVEEGKLASKCRPRRIVEIVEELVRAEPDAEAHSGLTAVCGEAGDAPGEMVGIRLLPSSPQVRIRLRRIQVKAVTVWGEERDRVLSRLPGPRLSVEALDDAELGCHSTNLESMLAA